MDMKCIDHDVSNRAYSKVVHDMLKQLWYVNGEAKHFYMPNPLGSSKSSTLWRV